MFVKFGLLICTLLSCTNCMSNTTATPAQKLPNIGWLQVGYNLFYGNPHAKESFDPGYKRSACCLFNIDYKQKHTTPDGRWLIPDNVSMPGGTNACDVAGTSTEVFDARQYTHELSIDVGFSIFYELVAFTASGGFKEIVSTTSEEQYRYVSTHATCSVYEVTMNPFVHPTLHPTFISAVTNKLPTNFTSNKAIWFEFLDTFGTHFSTDMNFGARWGYLFKSSAQQWSKMVAKGFNIKLAASYYGEVSAGVKIKGGASSKLAQEFASYVSSYNEFSLGNPPPANGSINAWLHQTLNSNLLNPLQYKLKPLCTLMSSEWTNNKAVQARETACNAALKAYCVGHLKPTNASICTNPEPPKPKVWGAIACEVGGDECLADGSVFDAPSKSEAQQLALQSCPKGTCQIVATFSDKCYAMYWGDAHGNKFYEAEGTTQAAATAAAETACLADKNPAANCKLILEGCTNAPPPNAKWGALACIKGGGCTSKAVFTPNGQGLGRPEARTQALAKCGGTTRCFIAQDWYDCGALAVKSNGYATGSGKTPQAAKNAALDACNSINHGGCVGKGWSCSSGLLPDNASTEH